MKRFATETPAVPQLERLDEEGVAAIHEASIHILETVGFEVNHPRARTLIEQRGGTVTDENVVTIPRGVVEESVERAPETFTLHGRNPETNVDVGGDADPVRAPGYGPPNVLSFENGRRQSTLADYEALVKLAQTEDVVTCTGYSICEPGDVDPSAKHYELLKRLLTLSDQPIMGPVSGAERAEACMEMVGMAVDDPALRRPYVVGLINTTPPRSIDRSMLEGLLTYAAYGQPLIVSSFVTTGTSAPPAIAASMAQANAENLAAITLAQLANPGTPVVYGVPATTVDRRYGSLSIGNPESSLYAAFAGQMGRYYDVPSRGGGGLTDARAVDYQSGFESMLAQAVTSFSDVDFVLHSAGILESYSTISPEKFVLDCEGLRYLDRFRRSVRIDEEHLMLDSIADADPAGHFLADSAPDDSTGPFFQPEVVDKRSHDEWQANGSKSVLELAHDRVTEQLDAYQRPPLDADVRRDLDRYVETQR